MKTQIFGRTHLSCPVCEDRGCFSEVFGSISNKDYCFSHVDWLHANYRYHFDPRRVNLKLLTTLSKIIDARQQS